MPTASNVKFARVLPRKLGFSVVFDDTRPFDPNPSKVEGELRRIPEVRRAEVNGNRVDMRLEKEASPDDVVPQVAAVISRTIGGEVRLIKRR